MLPSCAGAQPQTELRVGIPWTPENLDPSMNLSSIRPMVGVSMFDSLVGRDGDNRIVPQLTDSWRLVDRTTWQRKPKRGRDFPDGGPFKPDGRPLSLRRGLR